MLVVGKGLFAVNYQRQTHFTCLDSFSLYVSPFSFGPVYCTCLCTLWRVTDNVSVSP